MTGSLIHVDESLYSPDSEPANTSGSNTDIHEGDVVTRESGGGVHATDPSSDTSVDGIVPHLDRGDHLPEHDEDFSDPVYTGDGTWDNSDWVSFSIAESGSVWYPWTVKDSDLTAPDISKNDNVVVCMPNDDPVVAEEGYSDGDGNTYNESNSNAIVIGQADGATTAYGELVAVRVEESPSR